MQPYQIGSTDWIKQELAGLLGQQVTRDIDEIIRLYSLYDGDGQRWQVNTNGLDYTPTVKVTNIIAELIGKEARYMMGVEPELRIVPKEKDNQAAQANADVIGSWLTALLEEQKWSKKLLDAAKDCFIGKRVALKLTGRRGGRLGIQFRPSLEFVYDTDPEDVDRLTKVIFFYHTNESEDRLKQRIWRQKYELRDGRCYDSYAIYFLYLFEIQETPQSFYFCGKSEENGLYLVSEIRKSGDGLLQEEVLQPPAFREAVWQAFSAGVLPLEGNNTGHTVTLCLTGDAAQPFLFMECN